MTFREFIDRLDERGGGGRGKLGLYPLSYFGGPKVPAAFISGSADALYYMSKDDRFYHGKDDKTIEELPGSFYYKTHNAGDGPPWDIRKFK